MGDNELHIDESTHQPVPSVQERLTHALVAVLLGFLLVNIISFWMFPGIGISGLYLFSSAHSLVNFISSLTNIVILTFLAICGVFGWFHGKYYTDRLKGLIEWWKFW
ncbi:MAG: hypothetical protein PVH63_00270 [Balneolaceae bacterium]|jgi:hypothetical protein